MMTQEREGGDRMRTFADAEARLAETLEGYESREQQQALARKIEQAIVDRRHLVAEAGCGCGKSLGYLVPAILSGKRAVVSTATKALQDQIVGKDLPFLAEHLGVDFNHAVLKGRRNYLCGYKAQELSPDEVPSLGRVLDALLDEDFNGERSGLGFDITDVEWARLAADADDCDIYDCRAKAKKARAEGQQVLCFAEVARARARKAQVLVVNHALYMTDLKVVEASEGVATMIGVHELAIFDEGHEVEEYATSALGNEFRESSIRGLCAEASNFAHRSVPNREAEVSEATGRIQVAAAAVWRVFADIQSEAKSSSVRLLQSDIERNADTLIELANALHALPSVLNDVSFLEDVKREDIEKVRKRRERVSRRAINAAVNFQAVLFTSFNEMVRWVEEETTRRGQKQVVLKTAPVSVAQWLRNNLFDPPKTRRCGFCKGSGENSNGSPCRTCNGTGEVTVEPVTAILTSATLSVNGNMSFIADRLGIDAYDEIDVGSPFDFATQSLLYVPRNLPDPGKERAAWSNLMVQEIAELVRASEGRALLLFTSTKEMKNAHSMLSGRLPYTVLMQGQGTNKQLAEQFMADESSVLFATRSFFTGVDFRGEACSLVVIDKLPFPVPTEPLFQARCEAVKARSGNDFMELTVPMMTLPLKQGFGRLVRHREDRGVVAILDPRLKTARYGSKILRSLPPAREVTERGEVEAFFQGVAV